MARSFQKPLPPVAPGEAPVNAIPPAVALLALALGAVEATLSLADAGLAGGAAGIGWRNDLVSRVAVTGEVWDLIERRGPSDLGMLLRLVAYPMVHGGAVHALFACAMLLALGKFVAEAVGAARTLLVLLAATVGGAAAYGGVVQGLYPLFGAYPAIYGLIGAYTYLAWVRIGRMGGNRLGAFRLIGALLALQLAFGALFGANPTWVAEVAGFLAGGLAAALLAPGSLGALRARLRAR